MNAILAGRWRRSARCTRLLLSQLLERLKVTEQHIFHVNSLAARKIESDVNCGRPTVRYLLRKDPLEAQMSDG